MAVTRIKNNQITDSTIVANAKVVDYSISASKLANNLTYGSDFTISGNLTVNGTTTTVDTVNTLIQDPILVLADGQTSGTPVVDIGILGYRGTENSSFIGWKESASTFMAILSNTTVSNTTVNVSSYANFTASTITAQANLSVVGNIVGAANFTGNITGGNILTPGLISATGNINSGANIVATANIIGGNISTAGLITATGNITGGNLIADGAVIGNVDITGDIDVANITATGFVSAVGNITSDTNVNTPNVVGATGLTISTGSGDLVLNSSGNINASGNYINNLIDPARAQDAATKQYVDDAVSSGITIHEPVRLESPTALNGTYAQGGTTATVTATVAGNTVVFGSAISPQVNDQYWFTSSFQGIVANTPYFVVSAPNTSAAVLSTTYSGAPVSNITSATGLTQAVRINSGQGATLTNAGANAVLVIDGVTVVTADRILVYEEANAAHNGVYVVSEAGNATTAWQLTRSQDMDTYIPDDINGVDAGDYFYVQDGDTGAGESYVMTAPTGPTIIGYDNLTFVQFSASQVYSANTSAGLNLTGTVFSAKVDGVTTAFDGGGNISVKVSANLTTPNIGNATGNSLTLGGNGLMQSTTVSATGNVIGGNISTAGLITATGNITGGNVTTVGITSTGSLTASTTINATGNITGSNLILTSGIIDGPASGRITINGSDIDTDFAVDGDTVANVFYIDAGTGTASFGTSTQTTNAIVAFNTTTSILAPVGNTEQRPATGVTGMLRFNTTNNAVEVYDNTEWTSVGVPVFTVIDDEQFNGDGSTVAFTLGSTQTTNSCIVSINGVVQIPTIAYSVSGTDPTCVLTFTEAPASGDLIDVRQITTTTTVTSISNSSGNARISVSPTTNDVIATGDFVPSGNATANLGSPTNLWNELYISGNSIYIGDVILKANNGNLKVRNFDDTADAGVEGTFISTSTTSGNIQIGFNHLEATNLNGNIELRPNGTGVILANSVIQLNAGIINGQGNLVGNIGTSSTRFNTVFANTVVATATSALYADLAEKYVADAEYAPGTVVEFGGSNEVTVCDSDACARVAGVISTNPSYRMNDGLESEFTAMVALTGRVPTQVVGSVRKGDMMVSAGNGCARAEANPQVGTVIGKALADFDGTEGVIEVVVGRV